MSIVRRYTTMAAVSGLLALSACGGSGGGLSSLAGGSGGGLSSLAGGSGGGLSSLAGGSGGGLSSLAGGSGGGLSSLAGGSGGGLSSLAGGSGGGLSSLAGGSGGGLSSLAGGSGGGLSSLAGGSGGGLSSLAGGGGGGSGMLGGLLGGGTRVSAPASTSPAASSGVQLTLAASTGVNPTTSGQGAPVIVRVYQLTSSATFERAEFFRLLNSDAATLGADLVHKDEYLLAPGSKNLHSLTVPDSVQAIGVFAAFRQFQTVNWRVVIPVTPRSVTAATVTAADGLSLAATAR